MIFLKRPQFREDWAAPAQRFARLHDRNGQDVGIGDTVFRLFGNEGLETLRQELKQKHNLFCSKCNPREWMNRIYPYSAPTLRENKAKLAALADTALDRTLVIVANGPSHAEAGLERLSGVEGIDTMMVNRPFMPIWPTTYWVFVDPSVSRQNYRIWDVYKGIVLHGKAVQMYHPNSILIDGSHSFQTDVLNRGAMVRPPTSESGTTTAVAMQLACYLGYDRVFLFGLDMATDKDGKLYPWGSNPHCQDDVRIHRFKAENATLEEAALGMGELAERFTVCSSYAIKANWSFLSHFKAIPHETAVDAILGGK